MIADGRLDVRDLITHQLPFAEAHEGYQILRDRKGDAIGITLDWA